MFSVDKIFQDGFEILRLSDGEGCVASIVPACGGILNAFSKLHHGKELNVIDGYSSKTAFDEAAESNGFKSCKLSPYVCRLKNGEYKFAEKEYKVDGFYLGQHALHGLIYKSPFDVIKAEANEDAAQVELLYSYKKEVEGYPFKYDCRVIYELKKDNTLHIRTIIKNQSELAIPITDGWHPYFTLGGNVNELLIQVNAPYMLEFDEELIPTGKKFLNEKFIAAEKIGDTTLDNCFLVDIKNTNPVVILKDPVNTIQLEISCDKSYPIIQVYTPDHRKSIAIENLSGAPDAFNNGIGLIALAAGKEVIFSTSYSIRSL
jgi:aldose 1-epimerase